MLGLQRSLGVFYRLKHHPNAALVHNTVQLRLSHGLNELLITRPITGRGCLAGEKLLGNRPHLEFGQAQPFTGSRAAWCSVFYSSFSLLSRIAAVSWANLS
jgi:hypothetical protein